MNEKFYMILTNIGLAKFANAQVTETNVTFTQIAVGDSNGAYYNSTASMTALVHEVWRGNINAIYIDENNPNWVVCEGIIPTDVGGFMVREMGLFDDENNLLAVGKVPETYKPLLANGSAKDLYLKAILEVSNASAVTLKIDPAVTVASRKYVDDKIQIVSTNLANVQQQLTTHLDNDVVHLKSGERDEWTKKRMRSGSGYLEGDDANQFKSGVAATTSAGINVPPGGGDGWSTVASLSPFLESTERQIQIVYKWNAQPRALYFRTVNNGNYDVWRKLVDGQLQWIEATPQNGWQQHPNASTRLKFAKDSLEFIHIQGELLNGIATDGTTVTTLPVGYRPSSLIHIFGINTNSNKVFGARIFNNGSVVLYGLDGTGYINLSGSFYAGV